MLHTKYEELKLLYKSVTTENNAFRSETLSERLKSNHRHYDITMRFFKCRDEIGILLANVEYCIVLLDAKELREKVEVVTNFILPGDLANICVEYFSSKIEDRHFMDMRLETNTELKQLLPQIRALYEESTAYTENGFRPLALHAQSSWSCVTF